jgi:hypothetical protein
MATTTYARTMWRTQPYEPPDPSRPAIGTSWSPLAIYIAEPPTTDQWWMGAVIDVDVDDGTEGQIRLRSATGGEVGRAARIGSYVERVILGWEPIATADTLIYLEGRRTIGMGGGVKLLAAAVTLMVEPPAGQREDPTYPPGYVPPEPPPYPPTYTTSPPYA